MLRVARTSAGNVTRELVGAWGSCGPQLEGGAEKMDESTIDREAMGQLANALTFICGADHPTVAAMKKAVASGTERDIKNARTQFLKLKASDRRAALAMLKD
jgi:hypothetical protein